MRPTGPRMNERIRITPIRLIDENGDQAGVVETQDALRRARDLGMDLVEMAADSRPPVCRIMDYGRYKYEQSKKEKANKAKSKVSELKEVRLGRSMKIDPHDVEIRFEDYHDEDTQIQVIMDLVDNELSEPYNIFTYRYFVNSWPNLTFLAWHGDKCVGVIICKVRPAPPTRPASPRFSHPVADNSPPSLRAAGPSQERDLQGVRRHARGDKAVPQARTGARAGATVPDGDATRGRGRVRAGG